MVGRSGNQGKALEIRLKRLATNIEALARKDAILLGKAQDTADLRRAAAVELHSICAGFVASVNKLLSKSALILDPPEFSEASFKVDANNLMQINASGRILMLSFQCTAELVSTEDFRVPYTLSGSVRAFNQKMLDKDLIEEQLLFFTLEKARGMWRFFDARTYRSGPFDQEYLISLMEQLI
jgi:hypothetical protein